MGKASSKLILTALSRLQSERISQRVLYVLVALSVVVFGAFYLVGFDMEQPGMAGFNAPLFTDALIVLMWLMLGLAVVAFVVSLVRGVRARGKGRQRVNGIPSTTLSVATLGITVLLLVLTCVFAGTGSITINNQPYTDRLWLRVADMFVLTSLVLIVIAIGAVLFGFTRYQRKR